MGRADLHVHTVYSDGMMSAEMLVNLAVSDPGLDVIAVTDHDTMVGYHVARDYLDSMPEFQNDLEIIAGEEISTLDGHVLGLWLDQDIPPGMSAEETVAAIHEQGGVAVAAHPFTMWLRFIGLKGVGRLISDLPFDAVEIRNSNPSEIGGNTWTRIHNRVLGRRLPEVGGSDCHFLSVLGLTGTVFPGRTAQDLRRAIEEGATGAYGSAWTVELAGYIRDRLRLKKVLQERGTTLHFL
jgi:predicted metal-dependent phosphoesterase TrpH